jgi:hypothetical protein
MKLVLVPIYAREDREAESGFVSTLRCEFRIETTVCLQDRTESASTASKLATKVRKRTNVLIHQLILLYVLRQSQSSSFLDLIS